MPNHKLRIFGDLHIINFEMNHCLRKVFAFSSCKCQNCKCFLRISLGDPIGSYFPWCSCQHIFLGFWPEAPLQAEQQARCPLTAADAKEVHPGWGSLWLNQWSTKENSSHWSTKENLQKNTYFLHFPSPWKKMLEMDWKRVRFFLLTLYEFTFMQPLN